MTNRRRFIQGAAASGVALCGAHVSNARSATNNVPASKDPALAAALATLKSDMHGLVDRHERSGIAYGVMLRGRLVALDGYGLRDRARNLPMTPDTICRLFSMTRAISTVAFLTLVEEGKVGLDDPVAKFVPAFGQTQVLRLVDGKVSGLEPQASPMTVRHLLTYTSGLAYPQEYPAELKVVQSELMGPNIDTVAGIDKLAKIPLVHQPGSRWTYGFSGDVLGRIAEVASGQPFDRFLHERLLDRIGMKDTDFWMRPPAVDRLAKAYGPVGTDKLADVNSQWQPEYGTFDKPIPFLSAGGGLASSTTDYLRFLQLLLNGGEIDGVRILKPETMKDMLTGHASLVPGLAYRPNAAFGYGLAVLDDKAQRPFGIASQEAGWFGVANTTFFVDPQHQLAAVGMTQYFGSGFGLFPETFRNAVYRLIAT